MLGISGSYTIHFEFIDYSPDTHIIRFRVEIQPKLSRILKEALQYKLNTSFPAVNLSGDILKVNLKKLGLKKYLKGVYMKNGTVTINLKWR